MSTADASVSPAGVRLPPGSRAPVDVLFDGRRIFSIHPDRQQPQKDGSFRVPWPRPLRPYLHGSVEVTLRPSHSEVTLLAAEVAFDESANRIDFVDREGRPLVIDKWNKAKRPFEATSDAVGKALVADIAELLRILNDDLGIDAFLAYGTLLGAVREGGFIAHDDDADIAYLSRHDHPADIARESFRLARALLDRGWHVERVTAAFLQVWADADGDAQRKIDVFTAYYRGDLFTLERWVRTPLPRDAVTPLGQQSFEGVMMPAPHRTEDVLAATYGEGWRVPDPSFRFSRATALSDRSDPWFGSLRESRWRWELIAEQYEQVQDAGPSRFARWVANQIPLHSHIVDVGCGVGTDALWFAQQREVTGADYSPKSLAVARERAEDVGTTLTLDRLHLGDGRACVAQGATLAGKHRHLTVYARLLLDTLTDRDRRNFLRMASTALRGGGSLFVEFRTMTSPSELAHLGRRPFGRTLEPSMVRTEIAARGGYVDRCEITSDDGWQVCWLRAAWTQPPTGGG